MTRQTLSVLVENKPGVLARVASLFSRRGFNIESLAVGPTEHDDVSRMTIVVNLEDQPLEQVTKQLNKLVEVLKIVELEDRGAVERELLLVKVRADAATRSQVLETVQLFRAKVVDVAVDAVTIEVTGDRDKLEAMLRVLEPFGIRELVQSGMVAINRGSPLDHRPQRSSQPRRSPAARRKPTARPPPTASARRTTDHGRTVLRRRRRPECRPGPQRRRARLRQPGPRARTVAARLRRRRPGRAARGLRRAGRRPRPQGCAS